MPRGMSPNSLKALAEHRKPLDSERALKANQKSHEAKRAKKTFKEEFEAELASMVQGKDGSTTTVKNAITKQVVQKALKGDLRAAEYIRDTIGEKPVEQIEVFQPDFTELDNMNIEDGQDRKG